MTIDGTYSYLHFRHYWHVIDRDIRGGSSELLLELGGVHVLQHLLGVLARTYLDFLLSYFGKHVLQDAPKAGDDVRGVDDEHLGEAAAVVHSQRARNLLHQCDLHAEEIRAVHVENHPPLLDAAGNHEPVNSNFQSEENASKDSVVLVVAHFAELEHNDWSHTTVPTMDVNYTLGLRNVDDAVIKLTMTSSISERETGRVVLRHCKCSFMSSIVAGYLKLLPIRQRNK
ncbi:nitric oxide reductase large subunit [Babesia caballi]|uniref:Nitric oxide reductase large subunit n=1 Tax=Babesia caballi TaxID=5871 RepID=A0AAV4LVH3_BABCB|nr:nitric oxide reductase large subunit [Babesia caballi]